MEWLPIPASVAALPLELSEDNKRIAQHFEVLATRVAQWEEPKSNIFAILPD